MAKRLKDFLTTNSILYNYQFGFRQNHSTVLALIDVINDIYSHLENNEYVLGMYLDLQKTFDTVDHTILLCAFVHPCILYGLEVYGNTFPSYLDKLTILNNKLLRILQKKRTHLL